MARTMIDLMGHQPMPNLLPILEIRPDELHIIVSRDTAPIAENLRYALALPASSIAGPRSQIHHLVADPWDLLEVENLLEGLIKDIGSAEIYLNLTGGTKIMALAAYRVGQRHGLPMIYLVSAQSRRLLQFVGTGAPERRDLTVPLPIEVHLAAHGIEMRADDPLDECFSRAACLLAQQASDIQSLLAVCRETWSGKGGRPSDRICLEQPNPHERQALVELARLGLLDAPVNLPSGELCAAYAYGIGDSRKFLGGKWLEWYCYLADVHPSRLDDRAWGVYVRRLDATGPHLAALPYQQLRHHADNELDVVVSQNGRIAAISCKSGEVQRKDLDQLHSVVNQIPTGTYSARLLVTATPSVGRLARHATRYGITVVCAGDLPRLGQVLIEVTS